MPSQERGDSQEGGNLGVYPLVRLPRRQDSVHFTSDHPPLGEKKGSASMNQHQFFTGEIFDAYRWFGAHIEQNAVVFRTFAPNASRITLTGACNGWTETDLVQDCLLYTSPSPRDCS